MDGLRFFLICAACAAFGFWATAELDKAYSRIDLDQQEMR